MSPDPTRPEPIGQGQPPKHQILGIFLFAATLLALIAVAVWQRLLPASDTADIIKLMAALLAGILSYFVLGVMNVEAGVQGFAVRAGGGLAVFVLAVWILFFRGRPPHFNGGDASSLPPATPTQDPPQEPGTIRILALVDHIATLTIHNRMATWCNYDPATTVPGWDGVTYQPTTVNGEKFYPSWAASTGHICSTAFGPIHPAGKSLENPLQIRRVQGGGPVVTSPDDPSAIVFNDSAGGRHWIQVDLR